MKPSKPPKRSGAPARLPISNAETLLWDVQQVQLELARRAHELFELRGGEHGHDWEDWFRAESELLLPVSVVISQTGDRISVRANVGRLRPNDLKVAFEPRRIIVLGRKRDASQAQDNPAQLLCLIDLPAEIRPEEGLAELEAGLLKCELATARESAQAAAAGG
jgi:HSP20 family molecular chaperone IbpA